MAGLTPKTTIVPTDFSDLANEAIKQALEITDGQVHVIHVLPVLSVIEPGLIYGTEPDENRVEKTLKHMEENLSGANLVKHAVVGDPGHEIANLAANQKADLIVIPSHGYGFIKHVLLGSVAERVVRLAHCPVLVLRN